MERSVNALLMLALAALAACDPAPAPVGPQPLALEPWAPWPYFGVQADLLYEQGDLRFYRDRIDVGSGAEVRPAQFRRVQGLTDPGTFAVATDDGPLFVLDATSGTMSPVTVPDDPGRIQDWAVRDAGGDPRSARRTPDQLAAIALANRRPVSPSSTRSARAATSEASTALHRHRLERLDRRHHHRT